MSYNRSMQACVAKTAQKPMQSLCKYGKCRRARTQSVVCVKRALPIVPFILGAIVCALAIPIAVMLAVRTDPVIAERWTRTIQAGWERAIGTLTSWLPFSVMELFIVAGVIAGVFLIVRLFVDLSTARFGRVVTGALSVCVGAAYIFNIYVLSMGFGYYRGVMPIPQSGKKYDEQQAVAAIEYFLDDYTALANGLERDTDGYVVCPYTFAELAELMKAEYARLDDPYFAAYTPTAKPIANSWFLSDMLITGITFLPFGEACVNTVAPPTTVTVTMAHELAHAKGVQREGDANLLAWYLLVSSDNDYLRYCGYYGAFDNLLTAVLLFDDRDEYNRLAKLVSPRVFDERTSARKYWNAQPDVIGNIAEFFNNIYLKLNGALNGTGSYGDGNFSDVIIDTDPDTGDVVREVVYSKTQMMFFALYEQKTS